MLASRGLKTILAVTLTCHVGYPSACCASAPARNSTGVDVSTGGESAGGDATSGRKSAGEQPGEWVEPWSDVAYLVASLLFIRALWGLSNPRVAVRANLLGALGMAVAVGVTMLRLYSLHMPILLGVASAGIVVGAVSGAGLAFQARLTTVPANVPATVALLSGLGGLASMLVGGAALVELEVIPTRQLTIAAAASGFFGAIAWWGSLVAYGKLKGWAMVRRLSGFRGQPAVDALLVAATAGLGTWLACAAETGRPSDAAWHYLPICLTSSVLGVLVFAPIAAADTPVAIALLNAYSGLAAAATGFVLDNHLLIIAGSVVGASSTALCRSLCQAANRSLANVLVGAKASNEPTATTDAA
jgi:NAD(P) transhydrogenase subunit beta